MENTNKWYIEESSTGEYLKHVDTNNRHEKFRLKTNYFFHDLRIFIIYTQIETIELQGKKEIFVRVENI